MKASQPRFETFLTNKHLSNMNYVLTREIILYSNFRVCLIQICKPQKIGFLNCRKLLPDNPSKILQTSYTVG